LSTTLQPPVRLLGSFFHTLRFSVKRVRRENRRE
jgi:hypothetical protein